jgi:ferredoxin
VAEARHAAHGLLAGAGRAVPERPHRPSPDPARLFAGRAVRDFGPAKVDDETMGREAARCLQCDTLCNICVTVCPNRAIIALPSLPVAAVRGVAERTITGPTITISDRTPLRDAMQIAILADFCNECGNCAAFCPSSGAPYRDKPRVHLRAASFAEEGAGYHFPAPQRLESLHGGSPGLLSREDGRLVYKDDTVQVVFDEPGLGPVSAELAEGVHRADLDRAMESALLFAILSPSPLFGGDGA